MSFRLAGSLGFLAAWREKGFDKPLYRSNKLDEISPLPPLFFSIQRYREKKKIMTACSRDESQSRRRICKIYFINYRIITGSRLFLSLPPAVPLRSRGFDQTVYVFLARSNYFWRVFSRLLPVYKGEREKKREAYLDARSEKLLNCPVIGIGTLQQSRHHRFYAPELVILTLYTHTRTYSIIISGVYLLPREGRGELVAKVNLGGVVMILWAIYQASAMTFDYR